MDVCLDFLPIVAVVAHFFTILADRQKALELPHLVERIFEIGDAVRRAIFQREQSLPAAQPGKQLRAVHRLAEEIIHSRGKCGEHVRGLIARGQHDDESISSAQDFPDGAGDLEAIELRHFPIEQDDRGWVRLGENIERRLPVVRSGRGVAVALEEKDQRFLGLGIVLGHEHAGMPGRLGL